jgi:hypothetical protein
LWSPALASPHRDKLNSGIVLYAEPAHIPSILNPEVHMKVSRLLGFALFLSSSIAFTQAAPADDNCQHEKDGLKAQYPTPPYVVVTGSCHWLRPEAADNWAKAVDCPMVLGQGAVPFDPGHRTVVNWLPGLPFPHWASYLDYCVGYKGPALASDPAKAEALRKQIEDLRSKLKE